MSPIYSRFGAGKYPFIPIYIFASTSKTTDIMMFNSRNLGALIGDQEPHVNEWEEPQFGIRNMGIEEKYLSSACSTALRSLSPSLSLCTARCRHRRCSVISRFWQHWGAERGGLDGADLIGVSAVSRHWSPDYPCKDPVSLLARVCRVRTPLPRYGLPQAPERSLRVPVTPPKAPLAAGFRRLKSP